MGLIVDVYRSASRMGDCTLGGISSRFTRLCVVNVGGPFEPDDETPAVILNVRNIMGGQKVLSIVPAEKIGGGYEPVKSWVMMGGNYAATPDSRFSEKCEELTGQSFYGAVAIHDRIES
jgi:hypothetical protein